MQLTPRSFRLRSLAQLGAVGLALVVTQTGCPGGADLEHPEAWAGRFGTGAETGSGGSGPVAGSGGSTTAGTGNTAPPFDITMVDCGTLSASATIKKCANVGCHGGSLPEASLNLNPDSGLAARLKDKPATFGDINCSAPPAAYMLCVPTTCPSSALLVNSAASDSSWLTVKLQDKENGCGTVMPPPGGGVTLTTDEVACIEAIVKAIAGQ